MRKYLFIILATTLALLPIKSYAENNNFLATPVNCAAGSPTILVNGTDFTSLQLPLKHALDAAITVSFTRAAGSASTVDFEFQASYDGGTTWSTAYLFRIQVATNETAVSNVVRKITLVELPVDYLRLYRIVNNDSANALTACNANLSYR